MKIYTRTGDAGETALFGGGRVAKTHPRVEAYGTVDELNACIGRSLGALALGSSRERLHRVQHDLFALGAILATPPAEGTRRRPEVPAFPSRTIDRMERWMDEAEETLPELRSFVLPGGSPGAAELHVCRTVCRRAERAVVALEAGSPERDDVIRYLNRLSDLLFVLARLENLESGAGDVPWRQGGDGS